MIGIYKITNIITGRSYIGQSKDIEKRFSEHIYHSTSKIDVNINLYGKDNFIFEVLEECPVEKLDDLEDYYIQKYDTINRGYNEIRGGHHNIGESNPNSKLSESDVYNIREDYNNHIRKNESYQKYKHIISKDYFSNIWEGLSWNHIHMDVYCSKNIEYYKHGTCVGQLSPKSIFTDQEVINLRNMYIDKTAKEIYETVKNRCSFNTLQCILWGRVYKHLPIYDKKNKRWIN